ncbi:MAG TPA: hypothetical protein VM597_26390, partial [Gemmataceae bacterium]|nr:hypothetical protein [Gemmataceae bacterium]
MIRRKIWATATCCLAVAGAARADEAPKASLGKPQAAATLGAPQAPPPGTVFRGSAPPMNPGYPKYVPRNYTVPTPPTYASGPAPATARQQVAVAQIFRRIMRILSHSGTAGWVRPA